MSDLVTLDFQGTILSIVDHNGERWVTMKELAEALGYANVQQLHNLIKRNQSEFVNKISLVKLTKEQIQPLTLINYHGIIRASMLSNAPRAVAFRDWAETVLFEVMTKGGYGNPNLSPNLSPNFDNLVLSRVADILERTVAPITERIVARLDEQQAKLDQLTQETKTQAERWSSTFIPGNKDTTYWLTPIQRLRQILRPGRPPKSFNVAGRFDLYFAECHHRKTGSYPQTRCRRHIQKRPEWIVEPCAEMDELLRLAYRDYLKIWPSKQRALRLGLRARIPRITM